MKKKAPRLLFCAPVRGGGKTMVTCAVLRALLNRGLEPVVFKAGPDYIDPLFFRQAVGTRACNLDLFFHGEAGVRRILAAHAEPERLAVIEGDMGYYDGIAMTEECSAYQLAQVTQTPSILVVSGKEQYLTLAAQVKGVRQFRRDNDIRGVILNDITPSRYRMLRSAIEMETGLPVLGYLPSMPECAIEGVHLALLSDAERAVLQEKLGLLAERAQDCIELDALLAIAASAPELNWTPRITREVVTGRPCLAVAQDDAFCFTYQESMDTLIDVGVHLAPFSPLKDTALPEGCAGLYFGGGYPEEYAAALAANTPMRTLIREAIAGGMPCIAECGGFLYLHETLEGADGETYPMAGVIPHHAFRTKHLSRYGHVTIKAEHDGLLGKAGTRLPAHEFHYWDSEAPGKDFFAQRPKSGRCWLSGYHTDTFYAGLSHFDLSAVPEVAQRFVRACAHYQEERG